MSEALKRVDDRRVISGIVHVLKSGCCWCDCPPEYGPATTIYNRFVRWARRGIWENLASFCLAAALVWWI
jgi:transposase